MPWGRVVHYCQYSISVRFRNAFLFCALVTCCPRIVQYVVVTCQPLLVYRVLVGSDLFKFIVVVQA
jgi:hypothetical protein